MYSYNTSVPVGPAVPAHERQAALQGLAATPPISMPGSHGDVYANLSQKAATDYDRAVQVADADYMSKAMDMRNQMALRGMQQLAQQRANQQALANSRLSNGAGAVSSLLSGLFQ